MPKWNNWSGKVVAQPKQIRTPASEAELSDLLCETDTTDSPVRALGAAHSHSRLVPTPGTLIDLHGISGVVSVDRSAQLAQIRGGTRISDLGLPLRDEGVALLNQGDIDRQSIGGAIATGTHGTGRSLQNLSAGMQSARLVLPSGEIIECSREIEPDLFEVNRIGLGAAGILSEVSLSVRPAYKLQERLWLEDLDDVLERIDELSRASRHLEFFWMPGGQRAACKALEETEADPVYPLAAEGKRLAWSYEVLANHRPDKHSEMEYSVAEQDGPACVRELRKKITQDFPELTWPIEYRTLAADDAWLSTTQNVPTVTISVHQGADQSDEPLFRACEKIFRKYGGRPHWGKVHFLNQADLSSLYPRWLDWWRIRNQWDPKNRMMNDHLARLRPPLMD